MPTASTLATSARGAARVSRGSVRADLLFSSYTFDRQLKVVSTAPNGVVRMALFFAILCCGAWEGPGGSRAPPPRLAAAFGVRVVLTLERLRACCRSSSRR